MDASTGLRDAISWLPDEVLGKILSLLPTKQAVSTSVLAKKWRHVFRLVHTLDFDDSDLLQPEEGKEEWPVIRESFRNFVDRTLALQCGSPINNFSLKFHIHEMKEMAHVSSWICNALERGVLEMSLSFRKKYKHIFLPSELLTSKTLVKLTLGTQIYLGEFPPNTNVSLPALKSLSIDTVVIGRDDLCGVLLRGCPLLEELYVRHRKCEGALFYIYNPTIRKLSVNCEFEFARDGMSFDTPSLVSLNYSDYALEAYTDMNLASLVEARLDIRYSKWIQNPDLTGLIIGISNVQTLHLSPATADVIARCEDGLVLPVFKNLVKLSFGSFNERGWKLLPYLLKQSPKVETLICNDPFSGPVSLVQQDPGPSQETLETEPSLRSESVPSQPPLSEGRPVVEPPLTAAGHHRVRDVERSPEQKDQPESRRDAPPRAGRSRAREIHAPLSPPQSTGAAARVVHAPPSPITVRRSSRSRPPSVRRRESAAASPPRRRRRR